MKIAVIGAGASGLPAIKCCLDEGLEPVCFEKTNDIGGLWNWQPNPTDGRSTVMKSTIINNSKEIAFYSDFIVPREYPNYMHNSKVLSYFRLYAENFGLLKYIKFQTEVKRVSQAENFSETGRWKLEIKDLEAGSTRAEEFDGVLVCTGHHAEKKMPRFAGQEKFEGKILHTHDYTDYHGYEGKRVVVVGIGNSGADAAVELSHVTEQVYLSTRRGGWVAGRVSNKGIPLDLAMLTRFNHYFTRMLPKRLHAYLLERWLQQRFDHSLYGIKPEHSCSSQAWTINDNLPCQLLSGNIVAKQDIRRLYARSVEFEDGSVVENIDAIICGTGYLVRFPFMDHKAFEVKNNVVNFYKYVFPPDISPSTIAVVGCVQPAGGFIPIMEMQCRWATRVFKGDLHLPSSKDMWADIQSKRERMLKRYVESTRHTLQVDFIPFLDELAELCGCKTNIIRLLFTDPKLAFSVLFGPCCPYQYRLMGHGAWSGAREAIQNMKDRIAYPLRTRQVNGDSSSTAALFVTFSCIFTALIVILILLNGVLQ